MVDIIEENRRPSTGERLSAGLDRAMQFGEKVLQQRQAKDSMEKENQVFKELTGLDISGIQDPKTRQDAFAYAMQGHNQQTLERLKQGEDFQKNSQQEDIQSKNYDIVKNAFGKKFADVWQASEPGAQTELIDHALQSASRGESFENLLEGVQPEEIADKKIQKPTTQEKMPQMKDGKIPSEIKWPMFTKKPQGFTAKEWADTRKDWRKENVPIFEKNNTKLDATNADMLATKKLKQLSDKLPEGFERAIINPETQELYGLAQVAGLASPEVQEWVKIQSRFQNRAKDAFGSRVTNFDLQSYMKQFPGLLNTKEGRKRIIRMMELNYDLDRAYESALKHVYQHYGLGDIPQEEADRLARDMIEDETDRLHTEYLGHDAQNIQSEQKKNGLSGRLIDVIGPDGQEYEIDESEVGQLGEGYRIK